MKKKRGAALITVLGLLVVVITLSIALITIYNTASKHNFVSRNHIQASLLSESGLNVFLSYLSYDGNRNTFEVRYKMHLIDNYPNGNDTPLIITLNELDPSALNNAILSITSKAPTITGTSTTRLFTVSSVGNYNGAQSNPLNVDVTWTVDGADITYIADVYKN